MNAGLLWYDDDPKRSLVEKVCRAAHYYKRKHGVAADVCYVHPSVLRIGETEKGLDGVRIAPLDTVLINHLWVGREGKTPSPEPPTVEPPCAEG